MLKNFFMRTVAPLACLALFSVCGHAQSPTDNADSFAERYAYIYGYYAKVYADGLSNTVEQNSLEGFVASEIKRSANNGFQHCYDALVNDDDRPWAPAVYDFNLALDACDFLMERKDFNQLPDWVIQNFNRVKLYLEWAEFYAYLATNSLPPDLVLIP